MNNPHLVHWKFVDKNVSNGYFFDCDISEWEDVTIPHDWAIARPHNRDMAEGQPQGFLDRWGIGWYRCNISLDAVEDRRYIINFGGVHERCEVWFNELPVGGWNYGYSGFSVDVTEHVRAGDNLLAVRVDNSETAADRWYSGAGIYRNVEFTMHNVQCLDIEDLVVDTRLVGDAWELAVNVGAELKLLRLTAFLLMSASVILNSSRTRDCLSTVFPRS
jgi:beta-galactosidase